MFPHFSVKMPYILDNPVNPVPRCYPMIALVSAALLRAMQPALSHGIIRRTAELNGLSHDTGLGIAIWAAAAVEHDGGLYGHGDVHECFERDNATGVVRERAGRRPCMWHHAGMAHRGASPENAQLAFEGFGRVEEESPERIANVTAGWLFPDTLCGGTGRPDGVGPYDVMRGVAAQGSPAFGAYLDECLGLDREGFRRGSAFHEGRMPPQPPPAGPPPWPPYPELPQLPPYPDLPPEAPADA